MKQMHEVYDFIDFRNQTRATVESCSGSMCGTILKLPSGGPAEPPGTSGVFLQRQCAHQPLQKTGSSLYLLEA